MNASQPSSSRERPLQTDVGPESLPPLEQQRQFWNDWNRMWRFGGLDAFMNRQREVAVETAERAGLRGARILDIGCGTGWLGNSLTAFGEVTATDLSEDAIVQGREAHPKIQLVCGDFLTLDLKGPFDFVVSADALAHFYDQRAFFQRVAGLLRPGGTFLLMTQNRYVWLRRSKARTLEPGQVQRWPSLGELCSLLASDFEIERVTSIFPGGDRGLIWWVENRYVRGVLGRALGWQRYSNILERLRLGRELVIVARRR